MCVGLVAGPGFDRGIQHLTLGRERRLIVTELGQPFRRRSEADLGKSPRGQGVKKYLNERGMRILDALDAVAKQHSSTPASVAIAWLIARPSVTAPIASATNLEQLDTLPTLPSVASRLLRLSSAADADFRQIVTMIESDPALTSKLLALCRRADKRTTEDIASVDRAVVLLGFDGDPEYAQREGSRDAGRDLPAHVSSSDATATPF